MKFSIKTLLYVKKFSYFGIPKLAKIAWAQLAKISGISENSMSPVSQISGISENSENPVI